MFSCTVRRSFAQLTPILWAIAASGCSRTQADSGAQPSAAPTVGFRQVSWEQYSAAPGQAPAAGADLATLREKLPLLAQHKLKLVLQWPSAELDDPARWELVQSAHAMGVAVHPWLTLPEAGPGDIDPSSASYATTGYFPNATNADAWCAAASASMDAWQARSLPATTLVVDFEMRRERLVEFVARTAQSDVLGTLSLLADNRAQLGAAGFAHAKQRYAALVASAQQRGFRVSVSTLLPLLDDFDRADDDNDALRQGFQVPLDPSTPWDSLSFQVQRTVYQRYEPTSYLVYHYAQQALALFGQRAGIELGVTDAGWSLNTATYANPAELRQDAEAALAAGIAEAEIGVYSFLGMYKAGADPAQWLSPVSPHPPGWAPPPDSATPIIQGSQRTLRGLLQ